MSTGVIAADKRLAAALRAVTTALAEIDVPSMLIGGVAVNASGFVRATTDVDATVLGPGSNFESVLRVFGRYSMVPDPRRDSPATRERQLLFLTHVATGTGVDVSFAWFPFEQAAIARAVDATFHGIAVRVALPEDLIIYKATAWRALDQYDVEQLLLRYLDEIDIDRVRALLIEIFAVLETPERLAEFDKLVDRARRAHQ